ncbi:MAG: hypothetical protein RMJ66_06120 [Bacteroidia bacterium]|nr:hypothetical protein [Bacteroidia bacterium]MDW8134627.1 hypothetical protein [Bacteroidia bacterium]
MQIHALREIEEKLSTQVTQWLAESFPQAFLVEARLRMHRAEPEVYLRVDTDTGITLEQCVQIHLFLKAKLGDTSWLPDNFVLSVSSPGIGSPLKLRRQYPQNIGRFLSVKLTDGRQVRGVLQEVLERGIRLRGTPRPVFIPWEKILFSRVELPKSHKPLKS